MNLKRALIIAIIMAAPCLLASTNEDKTNLNPKPIKLIEDNQNNITEESPYHILGVKEAPSANTTVIEDCPTAETIDEKYTCTKPDAGKIRKEGVAIIFVGAKQAEEEHNVQTGDSIVNVFLYDDKGKVCFKALNVGGGARIYIPIHELGNKNYTLVVETDDLSKTNLYTHYRPCE